MHFFQSKFPIILIFLFFFFLFACGGEDSPPDECVMSGDEEIPAACNEDPPEQDFGEEGLTCINDTDCDSIINPCDEDPNKATVATFNASCDADRDGHLDADCGASGLTSGNINCDTCVGEPNPDQGTCSGSDPYNCADVGGDVDGDTICGDTDNCPEDHNSNQDNIDGDEFGDACDDFDDRDDDGDGVTVGGGDCDDSDAGVYPGNTTIEAPGQDLNCDGTFGNFENIVFVNGALFDSEADGSFEKPFNRISDALSEALANEENPKSVYIFGTTFMESNVETIVVTAPIEILGGWYCVETETKSAEGACSDPARLGRNVEDFPTIIEATAETDYLFKFKKGSDDALLDGVQLVGMVSTVSPIYISDASPKVSNSRIDTDGSTAIYIEVSGDETASPVITNCSIVVEASDTSNSSYYYGVYAEASGSAAVMNPIIERSSIDIIRDQSTSGNAVGLYFTRDNSNGSSIPIIRDNNIFVGKSNRSQGIYTQRISLQIDRNTIEVFGKAGGNYTKGIYIYSSSTDNSLNHIRNNLIKVGLNASPSQVYGIMLNTTRVVIEYNTLVVGSGTSTRVGLYVISTPGKTAVIDFNLFRYTGSGNAYAIYESNSAVWNEDSASYDVIGVDVSMAKNHFDDNFSVLYYNSSTYCTVNGNITVCAETATVSINTTTATVYWLLNEKRPWSDMGVNNDYIPEDGSSPIVDAGSSVVLNGNKKDIRGYPRKVDGDGNGSRRSDIGAFEYQPGMDGN